MFKAKSVLFKPSSQGHVKSLFLHSLTYVLCMHITLFSLQKIKMQHAMMHSAIKNLICISINETFAKTTKFISLLGHALRMEAKKS